MGEISAKKRVHEEQDFYSPNLLFETIPIAIYTTDNLGLIRSYNRAAVDLWGREPEIGLDMWCGSHKIYEPDGITPLALDSCPMAILLREGRKIENAEIIIEREDGQKRNVVPHPQPLFNLDGEMIGAVNTLVDITDQKRGEEVEAKFAAIIKSSEDGIISKTLEGYVTSWNKSSERIFGYTEAEMVGKHISVLIPPERIDEEHYILSKIRNGERIKTFETQRVSKTGKMLDISLSISPIYDKKGKIIGASKIVRDITRQKRLQGKIAESELLFKTIANASPTALWLTDRDCNNIFISDTWLHWTGKTFKDQIYRGWINEIDAGDRKRVQEEFLDCFANRKIFSTEFGLPNGNELRWCMTEGRPFYDDDGVFAGYAGSVTDISEIRELERRKDDFIKMASHELKTPITSINGYVQLLLNIVEEHDEEQQKTAKPILRSSLLTIKRQVSRLTRLVSELLDLSRIESGKLELTKTEFKLEDLVDEMVAEARHTTSRHALLYNSDFTGRINADRDRIGQVISNLLNNAIKYSRNSDCVEVLLTEKDGWALIKVKDHGIGIDSKDHEKIFERFYRVEGKSEQTYPGFGIGLFIANEITQRHDGKIVVESAKDLGSEFTIYLPLTSNNK